MFFLLLILLILALAVYTARQRKRRHPPKPFVPEDAPSVRTEPVSTERTARVDGTLGVLLSQVRQGGSRQTTDIATALLEQLAAPLVASIASAQPTITSSSPPVISTRSQPALRRAKYLLDGDDGYRTPTDRTATLSSQMHGKGLCSPRFRS